MRSVAGGAAFGAGTHPTTRTCLEVLLDLPVAGGFADLGTGTGVLAIAAAKLGWKPVIARDVSPESVTAARANASRNGVWIEAAVADLAAEPAPPSDAVAANIPGWLHEHVAASLDERVCVVLLSGFGPGEAKRVLAAYAARGLRHRRVLEPGGWVVALLGRD